MIKLRALLLLKLWLAICAVNNIQAQTVVSGKVTDANSGDPVPFANVVFTGTSVGATTDFSGLYKITINQPVDSVSASYVGYITKSKPVQQDVSQVIDFQLEENVISLQEVVFIAGENPAFEIMRNVVNNKSRNDKRELDAFEYDTYTKIEVDVDNISEKFRKRKIMQKITRVMDSVDQIAGEDGKPILPLFISETLSKYYYRNNPKMRHEEILKSKITGIGIEDGTLVSQFIGSSFQEYNFYQNWLNIVDKEFVSPIADGWKTFYEYDLIDSSYVGDEFCYRLDFFPKSEQDLAFRGTMWIAKKGYGLKQMDATVSPNANLNYLEKIKIQQTLVRTTAEQWLPEQTRILLDIGEVTNNMAGVLAKFYVSNKNMVVNEPYDQKFYEQPIQVAETFKIGNTEEFWNANRHEPLSATELSVYSMIDTLKNIPVVKTYTEILKIAVNGYFKAGKIDLGPYLSTYANNNIEGDRLQLGFKTNIGFSEKLVLGGHLAYGFRDERFKYRGFAEVILNRLRWTTIRAEYTSDLDQVGLTADDLQNNSVFLTATRFGDLIRPYYYNQFNLSAQRLLFKGFTQKIIFSYRTFDPQFSFAYKADPERFDSPLKRTIQSAEVALETRYARDELFVQNDNERISLGTNKWPVFTLRYTRGFKGIGSSDFDYNKIRLNISHDLKMGILGTSSFSLTGEHIFETLPYPLLKAHIGNESSFYTTAAFNLMNFSEFASDSYASLKYFHYFEGFLLNRIPLMKKLKWRLLATANVLYGNLRESNRDIIPNLPTSGFSAPIENIDGLGKAPYLEVGYGVENILKVLRVDFLHRLNYLDGRDVDKFGVKVSFQFIL